MQEEKQGGGKASLPIPTIHQNPHRPIIAAATHSSARQDKRGVRGRENNSLSNSPLRSHPATHSGARRNKRGVRGRENNSLANSPLRSHPATHSGARRNKRGVRGRESGSQERVSPRTNHPSNTPSADHRRATESPLGKRRSGAKTRMGLSAEKREEPFAFLRLFLPAPADRSRVRLRPVRGTGTLPDAGGAGGGGHATRLPRPCDA